MQVFQETGKGVWYSHLFKSFPQFVMIHPVKGFSVVNETEVALSAQSFSHAWLVVTPWTVPPRLFCPWEFLRSKNNGVGCHFSLQASSSCRKQIQVTCIGRQILYHCATWKVDIFMEFPCFLYDPVNVGNLISGSFAFSKPSLYIWRFLVHILLKPSLKDFDHNLTRSWIKCNCTINLASWFLQLDGSWINSAKFFHNFISGFP